MLIKQIRLRVKPGRLESFLARQAVWTDAMFRHEGVIDCIVAQDAADPDSVQIMATFRDRAALDDFMAKRHDELAARTGIAADYEAIEVRHLVPATRAAAVKLELQPPQAAAAHQIMALSEIYRASCILRAAVLAGLFDCTERAIDLAALAQRLNCRTEYLQKLIDALIALNLLQHDGDGIRNTPLAQRHLVSGGERFLGHLILHNTRPELALRWSRLAQELQLPDRYRNVDDHSMFLLAMRDIAAAGQAARLAALLDLHEYNTLLDIGGASGDYARELCRVFTHLNAFVLDQPQSAAFFTANTGDCAEASRLQFIAADYRDELISSCAGRSIDCALLSNVLRGETLPSARNVLRDLTRLLPAGGKIIIHDLGPYGGPDIGPLHANYFGLHLPDCCNATADDYCQILLELDCRTIETLSIDKNTITNFVVTANVS